MSKTICGDVIRKSVAGMHVGKLVKQFETGRKSTSEDSGKKAQPNRKKTPSLTLTPVRKTTSTKKMTPGRKSKTVRRFDNSNDVIVIDRKKTFIVSDEKEKLVKTPAKERKDRKSVSTPLKTPGKEVKAHAKGGRGSQVKSLKRGKKQESLEDTAKRLKLVKLKNFF